MGKGEEAVVKMRKKDTKEKGLGRRKLKRKKIKCKMRHSGEEGDKRKGMI